MSTSSDTVNKCSLEYVVLCTSISGSGPSRAHSLCCSRIDEISFPVAALQGEKKEEILEVKSAEQQMISCL